MAFGHVTQAPLIRKYLGKHLVHYVELIQAEQLGGHVIANIVCIR